MELHFFRLENLIKCIESLAREKYNFTITTNPNGSWSIEILKSDEHC